MSNNCNHYCLGALQTLWRAYCFCLILYTPHYKHTCSFSRPLLFVWTPFLFSQSLSIFYLEPHFLSFRLILWQISHQHFMLGFRIINKNIFFKCNFYLFNKRNFIHQALWNLIFLSFCKSAVFSMSLFSVIKTVGTRSEDPALGSVSDTGKGSGSESVFFYGF